MAYLTLPSRRLRQPQGLVRFRNDGIASKMCAGFVAGGPGVITTYGGAYAPTGTGSMYLAGTAQGLAVKSTAQDNRYLPLWPSANATTSPWETPRTQVTVVAFFKRTGTPGGDSPIFANYSPTTSPYYSWGLQEQTSSAGRLTFTVNYDGGSGNWTFANGVINDGKEHIAVGTWFGAGLPAYLYLDGVQIATSTPNGTISYLTSARGPAIGNWWAYTSNRAFIGEVYGGALAPVAISAAEAIALSRTPAGFWGELFQGDPRRLYFDLSRPKGTMRPTVMI